MRWRLFVSNATSDNLPMTEIVPVYRGSTPTIERLFSRFKGRPLGLPPLFVRRDDHLKGLFRLLTLALRLLNFGGICCTAFTATNWRSNLGFISCQCDANNIATNDRTTERLLCAVQEVTVSIVKVDKQRVRHVTPLSPLQSRIFQLLKFSNLIYTELTHLGTISD